MHHDQDLIYMGRSVNGGGHREHLVPCVVLVNQAFHMYEHGLELSEVASLMRKYLRVADITKEEARHLDYDCKMKTRMPSGWSFETGAVTARLDLAGIKLVHDGQA
ncbi:MAG: hypothetical protein B7Y40_08540 [Gammaproteobacteria bacterium 28-57-27]|nr:MAG: hypothetical protein B7Y40_08540 [Gammaproteobacteria bacterium 28-57-27]